MPSTRQKVPVHVENLLRENSIWRVASTTATSGWQHEVGPDSVVGRHREENIVKLLLIAGSTYLVVSLLLAWILVGVRILNVPALKHMFPADDNLVKAHIDYILMSVLLYAFYALSDELSMFLIVPMITGAGINPFLFVVIATKDVQSTKPGPLLNSIVMLSFILTTIGFAGAAVSLLL